MKEKIHYYIFIFFLGSIFGWLGEVIFNFIVHNKLVNPGTLSLFWCPIYGVATVIIDLITKHEYKWWKNALIIAVVSAIDEYLSAVISEEIFNNRLWDYSNHPFNFQGRICLDMILLFTVFGLLAVYLILPKTKKIYRRYSKKINKFNYGLLILFVFNIIFDTLM